MYDPPLTTTSHGMFHAIEISEHFTFEPKSLNIWIYLNIECVRAETRKCKLSLWDGSGIPERTFVKNSYKRSRTSLPSSPLLFIAFFTSHRSPLSERLEQATHSVSIQLYHPQKSIQVSPACSMLLALPKFDQTMWFSWSYFRSDPKFYPHFQTRPCTPLQNMTRAATHENAFGLNNTPSVLLKGVF